MGLIMTKQFWSEQLYVTYMIVNFYIDFNQKIVSIDFTMDIGQYRNHTRVIDVNCNICHSNAPADPKSGILGLFGFFRLNEFTKTAFLKCFFGEPC